jgi:hypothetical protein
LKKAIIPCKLQANYSPDGWLGIIFGSKIYIDFSIKTNDKAIDDLKNMIILNDKVTPVSKSIRPISCQSVVNATMGLEKCSLNSWSSDDVNKWLIEKRFDYRIKRQFQNCNGTKIVKFFSTKKEAPEYFYSSISKNGTIEICHVFEFIDELEKLFQ